MAVGDLTHFLLPSSRIGTDVTFEVSGREVAAHKSFLAAAHSAFEEIFYGVEAEANLNRVRVRKLNMSSQYDQPLF